MSDNDPNRRNALFPTMSPKPPRANALVDAATGVTELHTHPKVGHIAGVGMRHPEKLTFSEIQTLCGEVDRHIRRMQGKG